MLIGRFFVIIIYRSTDFTDNKDFKKQNASAKTKRHNTRGS